MNRRLKILAIVNPISGTGKQKGIDKILSHHIDSSRFLLNIEYTQYGGHACELSKQAIENNYDGVLAIGGDGTINEIARALTGSDVAMGIIPCGSGNGLARHLGIPMKTVEAINWLNRAHIYSIDTVRANNQLFVNVAGVGFDAFISHQFAKMNSRGLISYIKAVIKSFFKYPQNRFVIEQNGKKRSEEAFLLSFANSSQFGNNAYIAPKASINDGLINLIILKKPRLYQIPSLILKTFGKKIDKSSLFSQITGKEFRITQDSCLAHVDGEPIELGKNIHIKVYPQSLKIFKV